MSQTTRVFVVAVVLVLLALASYGSAFTMESLLRTAERNAARSQRHFYSDPDACEKQVCDLPVSDECPSSGNGTDHRCEVTSFCNSTSSCQAKLALGEECSYHSQCASDVFKSVLCMENTTSSTFVCTLVKTPEFPGGPCEDDSDCYSGSCTNKTCDGNSIDEPCQNDGFCESGLYCNQSTNCLNISATGEDCDSSAECSLAYTGNVCINGKCALVFSVEEDGECDPYDGAQCSGGLYCDPYSSKCKKYERIECQVGNDTECEALPQTSCDCSSGTGKGVCANSQTEGHFPKEATDYLKKAVQCALDNSIPIPININTPSDRFLEACRADLECGLAEWMKSIEIDSSCVPYEYKCDPVNPSEDSSASMISAATGVVVSALAAVAALL